MVAPARATGLRAGRHRRTYADAVARAERSLAVRRSLRPALTDMRLEERVLYFLYVRDAMELAPQCTLTHPMLYHYPVVDALAQRGEDPVPASRPGAPQALEPAQLVNAHAPLPHLRQRSHPLHRCLPALLQPADPQGSPLHCFSWVGMWRPRATSTTTAVSPTPQCSAALRHIVDYDRPLTQYACGSCHHVFVETTTQARCLACRTSCAPSALDVREVASLRLSAHRRTALRAGQIQESFAAPRHRQLR